MLFVTIVGLFILFAVLLFGVLKEGDTPRRVSLLVTESAANTFTAAQHNLPNARGDTVYDLDKVDVRFVVVNPAAADDFGQYRIQLQRDTGSTPAAFLNSGDQNLLYEAEVLIASGTEAADITMFEIQEIGKDHVGWAEYIANDTVWLCVAGVALASAVVIRGKLTGSVEKLSDKALGALLLSQID